MAGTDKTGKPPIKDDAKPKISATAAASAGRR